MDDFVPATLLLACLTNKPDYATWLHPCSNLLHQLDHFFISPAPTFAVSPTTQARTIIRPALQTRPGRIVCSDGASYAVCQSGSGLM